MPSNPRQQPADTRRFDVTVHETGGGKVQVKDVSNDTAREFEDLPFTAPNVAVVEVHQR